MLRNKYLLVVVLLAIAGLQLLRGPEGPQLSTPQPREATPQTTDDPLARAYAHRRSDVQVAGRGVVTKVLAGDSDGSRHQRFILRLPSGRTLLVAHNIDLAPRIDALREGDTVDFYGEYEWNEKGGVLHWTHHDPAGRHPGGWLQHDGRRYE